MRLNMIRFSKNGILLKNITGEVELVEQVNLNRMHDINLEKKDNTRQRKKNEFKRRYKFLQLRKLTKSRNEIKFLGPFDEIPFRNWQKWIEIEADKNGLTSSLSLRFCLQ